MSELDFRDARVLIIDDQEMNIAMLSGMLKKHGFRQRFSANDPFVGIEMFQRIAPHLVLLDIEMPGLDGYGVLARIRAISPDVMIPVIVLTAHTEQAVRLKAIDAGASDFLTKPFDGMEVIGRARNMSILGMMSRRIADENRRLDEAVRARTAKLEQMVEILRTAESALSAKVSAADESTALMRNLASRGARSFAALADTIMETSLANAGETPEWLAVSGIAERIKLTAEEIELVADAARRDLTVSRQRVDFKAAVNAAVAAVAGTAEARKISLSVNLEAAPAAVITDKSWFGVAVQRVLAEAIDCTPPSGAVRVAWEDSGAGSGWLAVTDGGSPVVLAQPRELAMPFDVRRVQPAARDARTGLGLAIAAALSQMMGSDLEIAGTGEGAVYRIRLATE
ncbi:response regulator [Skermanella rosea]|uniref:hybrid sensor histidine kinase/response regulator n=1 Tax=Skermanella rosea TaxID=1817965 RepID=UPI00193173D6|nr:response regulator [Skermanella rosea]UEM06062.1 response regulator [Skermanella rosea]